ncbi:MAG: hypothetical protein WCF19_00295 [Chlamydiales bacterium]
MNSIKYMGAAGATALVSAGAYFGYQATQSYSALLDTSLKCSDMMGEYLGIFIGLWKEANSFSFDKITQLPQHAASQLRIGKLVTEMGIEYGGERAVRVAVEAFQAGTTLQTNELNELPFVFCDNGGGWQPILRAACSAAICFSLAAYVCYKLTSRKQNPLKQKIEQDKKEAAKATSAKEQMTTKSPTPKAVVVQPVRSTTEEGPKEDALRVTNEPASTNIENSDAERVRREQEQRASWVANKSQRYRSKLTNK